MKSYIAFILSILIICFALKLEVFAQGPIKRVAIVNFIDYSTSNIYGRLVEGLPDLLSQELGSFQEITIIERTQINKVLREMNLSRSHNFDPSTAARLGRLLGAQTIILGGLYEISSRINLSARLIWVETGKIERGFSVEGSERDLFDMVKKLASEVRYSWSGSLYIKSSSEGVIYINGDRKGTTPGFFTGLLGNYTVKVERWGCYPVHRNVQINPGDKEIIDALLLKTAEQSLQEQEQKRIVVNKKKKKGATELLIMGVLSIAVGVWGISGDEKSSFEKILGYASIGIGVVSVGYSLILWSTPAKNVQINIGPIKKGFLMRLNFKF